MKKKKFFWWRLSVGILKKKSLVDTTCIPNDVLTNTIEIGCMWLSSWYGCYMRVNLPLQVVVCKVYLDPEKKQNPHSLPS